MPVRKLPAADIAANLSELNKFKTKAQIYKNADGLFFNTFCEVTYFYGTEVMQEDLEIVVMQSARNFGQVELRERLKINTATVENLKFYPEYNKYSFAIDKLEIRGVSLNKVKYRVTIGTNADWLFQP